MKEAFLPGVLSYMGRLTNLVVMLGDMNDHPTFSRALTRAFTADMHRVTFDEPTTLNKHRAPSGGLPLDHCFVNTRLMHVRLRVNQPLTEYGGHLFSEAVFLFILGVLG